MYSLGNARFLFLKRLISLARVAAITTATTLCAAAGIVIAKFYFVLFVKKDKIQHCRHLFIYFFTLSLHKHMLGNYLID